LLDSPALFFFLSAGGENSSQKKAPGVHQLNKLIKHFYLDSVLCVGNGIKPSLVKLTLSFFGKMFET
jgi:hypothetical protein